jgi:hypothetical protein
VYAQCLRNATRGVFVYQSLLPGVGKSYQISKRLQIEPHHVLIAVNSYMSTDKLIAQMAVGKDHKEVAFYFNLSASASSALNYQLYQLLFVGVLVDIKGDPYYLRKEDSFYVELPSLPEQDLDRRFGLFRQFANQVHVTTSADSLDVTDDRLQFVCKMLNLFRNNHNKLLSDEVITVDEAPLSRTTCFELLRNVIQEHLRKDITKESLILVCTHSFPITQSR